jgi:transposase
MPVFPVEHHLSSWAGICPGDEESAEKRLRSHTTRKNRWLRRTLVEAAWAAGRTKGSNLGARYRRRAARREKERALLAVAHSLLVIFNQLLNSDME